MGTKKHPIRNKFKKRTIVFEPDGNSYIKIEKGKLFYINLFLSGVILGELMMVAVYILATKG